MGPQPETKEARSLQRDSVETLLGTFRFVDHQKTGRIPD